MTDQEQKTEQLKTARTETEDVILKRRSVRIYQRKQVPAFMIKRILEAGRFAPSAGNGRPWKFIVVREPEILDGISQTVIQICKGYKSLIDYRYNGNNVRRMLANLIIKSKPNDLHPVPFSAITLIADGRLQLFHDAPTVIFIFQDVRGIGFPALDCGMAAQNMVIAAHSMGLGTCYIGFSKPAFENSKIWTKRLGIDYPYKFVTSLAIGYPVGKPDGMVARPTHAVDWYEDGKKETIY
ncbi:MAG: nitroreductase family protein [Chloroflexi bacterium]|nr:nitroreductase family protein [Chloroflexota bacterium]